MIISDKRDKIQVSDLQSGDIIKFKISGAFYMVVREFRDNKYSLLHLDTGELREYFVEDLDIVLENYNEIDEIYRGDSIKITLS